MSSAYPIEGLSVAREHPVWLLWTYWPLDLALSVAYPTTLPLILVLVSEGVLSTQWLEGPMSSCVQYELL